MLEVTRPKRAARGHERPHAPPASSVLMPVGYATTIGGMSTTIVTSTNLLVVQVSAEMGMAPMGMFHQGLTRESPVPALSAPRG